MRLKRILLTVNIILLIVSLFLTIKIGIVLLTSSESLVKVQSNYLDDKAFKRVFLKRFKVGMDRKDVEESIDIGECITYYYMSRNDVQKDGAYWCYYKKEGIHILFDNNDKLIKMVF